MYLTTRLRKRGETSSSRFGWNRPGRGGRTWCRVKMAPTPATKGFSAMWAPVK